MMTLGWSVNEEICACGWLVGDILGGLSMKEGILVDGMRSVKEGM